METTFEKHSVGKTIATLRKEKGMTQVELAEKLHITDKAVSKWEKDDAFPSIDIFPALATIFGVSVDYLMTGRQPEREIVIMSKAEVCAKEDDPSLLDEKMINSKDEDGKNILDYVVKYESLKVFSAICDKYPKWISKIEFGTAFKFSLIANRVDILKKDIISCLNFLSSGFQRNVCVAGIKNLFHQDKTYIRYLRSNEKDTICCISDDMLDIIVCDKRVNDTTMQYLLSKHEKMSSVWFQIFPYLIHQSYLHNNTELLDRILAISIDNNQYIPKVYGPYSCDCLISQSVNSYMHSDDYFDNGAHGLVRVLEKTIKLALERGDFELVEKFNSINSDIMNRYSQCDCYIADSDMIRVAKLKHDNTVSKEELAIQSALHNGILCIDEIVETGNYGLIKKALEEYPISEFEIKYNEILGTIQMLENKNWRELFQYAVDNGWKGTTKAVLERDYNRCERNLNENLQALIQKREILPDSHYQGVNSRYLSGRYYNRFDSAESVIKYIGECKIKVLTDCKNKYDKESIISELTKDFFEKELEKGNNEIVIIKLCVRLEAILRYDYKYTGNLYEMMDYYCSAVGHVEDGWDSVEADWVKYLHKLRKCRNSIAHPSAQGETMSENELKYCINHICEMG